MTCESAQRVRWCQMSWPQLSRIVNASMTVAGRPQTKQSEMVVGSGSSNITVSAVRRRPDSADQTTCQTCDAESAARWCHTASTSTNSTRATAYHSRYTPSATWSRRTIQLRGHTVSVVLTHRTERLTALRQMDLTPITPMHRHRRLRNIPTKRNHQSQSARSGNGVASRSSSLRVTVSRQ